MLHSVLRFTPLVALPLALFACSATKVHYNNGGGGAGAGDGGDVGGQGQGGGIGGIGVGGGGGSCASSCTADLKKVIDCNGNRVTMFGPDQECAGGQCIDDPCEAARQSSSSYGCDYWSLKTDIISEAQGACFAAFVANTWTSPVKIQVDYNGQTLNTASFVRIPSGQGQGLQYGPYDPNVGLPAGEVGILFPSRDPTGFLPDCPQRHSQVSPVVGTSLTSSHAIPAPRAFRMLRRLTILTGPTTLMGPSAAISIAGSTPAPAGTLLELVTGSHYPAGNP